VTYQFGLRDQCLCHNVKGGSGNKEKEMIYNKCGYRGDQGKIKYICCRYICAILE